jgi:hypothetical protein
MIPKTAWFYWEGPEMSPLRRFSIESFQALNPGWTVQSIPHPDVPRGTSERARISRSDYARYLHLEKQGGLYFDTDIVFQRPIPNEWLDSDLIVQADPSGQAYAIAILGCSPGEPAMRHLLMMAEMRMKGLLLLGCQSLGIELLRELRFTEVVGKIQMIPAETFLPVPWHAVERLWSPMRVHGIELCHGIHWYGGDPLSKEREAEFTADDDSPVGEAVRRVLPLMRGAEAQALSEQHGLQ